MQEDIWQTRVDLAAALRLAARFGLNEGICNHFSFALPGSDDLFLINCYGRYWSQMRASEILVVTAGGEVLDGEGEFERTAFCIHSRIHLAHPRARCVLHTHMPYATALCAIEGGRLEPVHQNSLRFYGDVAYDPDFAGLATEVEEGDRIASMLGGKRVLFLANHGVVVTGESVAQAFNDLYYLERACQVQVLAMSTGRDLKVVGDNVAAMTRRQFDGTLADQEKYFAALKRLLDEEDATYAT